MKKFEDFWNSLTEDDFCNMAGSANDAVERIISETADSKNMLGNQIAMISIQLTKELLSHYHSWLSEQLD